MAEKRLFEIEARAYAYAETEAKAIRALQFEASLHDMTFEASETSSVDADWWDAIPYGGEDNRTCAQLLQAQEESHMSEDSPSYSPPSPGEGSIRPACCLACGSPAIHSLAHRRQPTLACLAYLREQIVILQGEVLALRLQLAARPEPIIHTYQQLSGVTGIPVARLERLRVFAPEPEPNGACLTLSPDGQHRCTNPHGHGGAHRVQDQYGMLGWFDPPIVPSVFTPQTQASAAVADAAQWGQPGREEP